jgi:hypothetical protein
VSDEEGKPQSPEDAEIEREVLSRRKFSLTEAIGRAAGDLMKGASPVTRKRQAELAIEQYLEGRLDDAAGVLRVVLQRRAVESEELLAEGYEAPLRALGRIIDRLLGSDRRLRRFVGEVDAEWGRIYAERPYFELEGRPPRAGDPYTVESVRTVLTDLLDRLRGDSNG